jgi:VWFA-related protein
VINCCWILELLKFGKIIIPIFDALASENQPGNFSRRCGIFSLSSRHQILKKEILKMKNYISLFLMTLICISLASVNFAQSRRPAIEPDNTKKVNKRPPQTAATPTPPPLDPEDEPNTTNIERVEPKIEVGADDGEVIKVETEIVSVPVKVSDRKGRFIGGLTKENFQILEENAPHEIAYFSNEQEPFTVALVLDMSYSAKFKAAEIQQAAMNFINQLRSNDRVLIVSFDEKVYVHTAAPTTDRQALQRAVKATKIGFGTSLYEAVDLVINEKFKKIGGRKAIVLFSDGVDTTSRKAYGLGNLSDALELDALVYPIQYDTFNEVQAIKDKPIVTQPTIPSPIPTQNKSPFPFPFPSGGGGSAGGVGTMDAKGTSVEEYRKGDEYLNEMANRTGGRLYQAGTIDNLTVAFSKIAAELREYYSLGFYPKADAKNGKKHKIKVRVNQDGAVVQARDSYVIGKKEKKDK